MSMTRIIILYIYLLSCGICSVSQTDCGKECELCNNDENECQLCRQGFYKSGNICNSCSKGCLSCQTDDVCDICKDGFGHTNGTCHPCLKGCAQCEFEERNKCVSCLPGYYIDGDIYKSCTKDSIACSCSGATFWNGSTCSLCPTGCTRCSSSQSCSECKSGYYGQTCHYPCSEGCNASTCAKSIGSCHCKIGFSELRCDIYCPEKCEDCFSVYDCSACKPGYYGETCRDTCPFGCTDHICDINNGTCIIKVCKANFVGDSCDKCEEGKYGEHCQNSCPVNCASCDSDQYCTDCNDGFYGKVCIQKCSSNCIQGMCTKEGSCPSCMEGYYGHTCDERCPDKCQTCVNNDDCRSCQIGFYGNLCQFTCSDVCIEHECYQKNGTCLKGCIKCDQNSGKCRSCHNNNTDGENCQDTCSFHCINERYPWESAQCDHGCMEGFYGETCDLKCACLNLTCRQDDGAYMIAEKTSDGLKCELEDTGASVTITGLAVTVALIIITISVCIIFAVFKRSLHYDHWNRCGTGAVTGVLIIITISVYVIFAVNKRKQRSTSASDVTVFNSAIEMNQRQYEELLPSQGPVYTNLQNDSPTDNQTTHIYDEIANNMI